MGTILRLPVCLLGKRSSSKKGFTLTGKSSLIEEQILLLKVGPKKKGGRNENDGVIFPLKFTHSSIITSTVAQRIQQSH